MPYEQIVKGFELTKDRYVVVTPEELETLDPEKSRTIDISRVVIRSKEQLAAIRRPATC